MGSCLDFFTQSQKICCKLSYLLEKFIYSEAGYRDAIQTLTARKWFALRRRGKDKPQIRSRLISRNARRAVGLSVILVAIGCAAGPTNSSSNIPAFAGSVSPNGSTLPTESSFTDSSGVTWTLTGGIVYADGAKAGSTSGAVNLYYLNANVYEFTASGNFYEWNASSSTWLLTSDPRMISANGATTISASTAIIDSNKNIWTFLDGVIYENGIAVGSTANVTELIYLDQVVYEETSAGAYYAYNGNGSWIDSSNPSDKVSIKNYTNCDGVADDSLGAASAFLAARNYAFTLVVDCPVYIHVGLDVTRPIFIDDGTTVTFEGGGKFIVDDIMQPTFVIANSSNILLNGWNVEYNGSMPVDEYTGYYVKNGTTIASTLYTPPAQIFNNVTLRNWYASNRSVSGANPVWSGPTNTSAVFYIVGNSSNIAVSNMIIGAPTSAGASGFVPVVFAFGLGFNSNQTVTSSTPETSAYMSVPNSLSFSNIDLDGTLMGFVGTLRESTFKDVTSNRYSDLQDSSGNNVGGEENGATCAAASTNCWFAPPHLFYFNYDSTGDSNLFNYGIVLENITDTGTRVGNYRNHTSGDACSLKIGGTSITVNNYITHRPDGFMDTLTGNTMLFENITATYDSSYLAEQWPAWRFTQTGYVNTTFQNVTLTDESSSNSKPPLEANSSTAGNSSILFENVVITVNSVSGSSVGNGLLASIGGQSSGSLRTYNILTPAATGTINASNQISW